MGRVVRCSAWATLGCREKVRECLCGRGWHPVTDAMAADLWVATTT